MTFNSPSLCRIIYNLTPISSFYSFSSFINLHLSLSLSPLLSPSLFSPLASSPRRHDKLLSLPLFILPVHTQCSLSPVSPSLHNLFIVPSYSSPPLFLPSLCPVSLEPCHLSCLHVHPVCPATLPPPSLMLPRPFTSRLLT